MLLTLTTSLIPIQLTTNVDSYVHKAPVDRDLSELQPFINP